MRIDGILAPGLGAARFNAGVSSTAPGAAPGAASPASFEQALGQTFNNALSTIQGGESAAIQGLQGSLAPAKVVEAVMGAQRTLQSALAIRDKAIAAYQEISRMAI